MDETQQRVTALFTKEALSKEAEHLTKPRDWERLKDIRERHETARATERKNFDETYHTRFDEVRRKLIAEAGSKAKEHTGRFGTDQFSKERLSERADRLVRNEHAQRLLRIDQSENSEMEDLVERARARNRPVLVFDRATERGESSPSHPPKNRNR